MHFETAFLAAYAVVLLLASAGLQRIGRVSSDAWAGRALAAYRAQAPEPVQVATPRDWPHSEVPRLHTALAAVACAAAALLCMAQLVRHRDPAAVALLMPIAALAGGNALRLVTVLRATPPR